MAMLGLLELFVAFLFSLVFLFTCFFIHKKPHGQPILKNWPFLGMLPGMLPQIPRIYDWTVEVLEASNLTFYFKGPWLSGTDMLFTADPKNINHILSSNFGNYPKGPEFKKIFDVLGEGILTVDLELWEDLRKSNHAMFHNQDFLELSLSSNKIEFGEAADIGEEAIYYRHFKPVMLWRLQNWLGIGLERKMRTALATVNRMFAKIISSRRKEEISRGETEPSKDALTYYMNVDTTKYKLLKPKNDTFIRDVIFSLVLAGRDTTSSALTWFFWLLSKNPQVMAKIRHEINTKYDPEDLEKLVYLHAALSESMRLYPPLPFNHKAPAKPDVLPSGHKVEPESKIVICIYALGRMRSVWGEDASDFKPERWISDNGGLRHEPSYKYVAFNSGPRTCLGKHLALLQMKIVALEIIKNYDFKVIEGHKIEAIPSILLRMKHGLKVTVTKKM
ncbi:alkane hydroxylase MAH1 isoform X2 [Arabidopsis lyrata subsp. lyrata]|uniref:alkane hydroxylase MAH1 isoform X2 n=1 Tax=Arabidopsis lyrata subsp. lyrata TaxID=81972 RepID=UPI000A29D79B|nr:alkane hydroxylase MAH1 isoform X2 [Arabidopsis lyrata subsp. lyrata]|eukprot:XP_020866084.1 alkane hydroxylase MAH1 isoform X2 [Arabidopsis lyrata subsp. lyrata]